MSQLVGGNALADTRRPRVPTDELPKPLAGETAASQRDEEGAGSPAPQKGGTGLRQVGADGVQGAGPNRDEPLLVAFAPGDKKARIESERLDRERHQLAHSKSGGIQQGQHGAVADAGGSFWPGSIEERFHLWQREHPWKSARRTGRLQVLGGVKQGVPFGQQKPVENAKRHQVAGAAARRQPTGGEHVQVTAGVTR